MFGYAKTTIFPGLLNMEAATAYVKCWAQNDTGFWYSALLMTLVKIRRKPVAFAREWVDEA
jgi:hypothetical protein